MPIICLTLNTIYFRFTAEACLFFYLRGGGGGGVGSISFFYGKDIKQNSGNFIYFIQFPTVNNTDLSLVMRKQRLCICKNKDADQLRGKRQADQRLCFCYIDSTIPLLSISKISGL